MVNTILKEADLFCPNSVRINFTIYHRSIFISIRYSQDFKDLPVKLHHEGRSLKSLAEEFGPSKDSIAIWVKQATPIMIKGQSKTLKDVKQLEKRLAILEEENEILSRIA